MNYALIDNGVVINIIYLDPKNADEFPNAVPYGELSVQIGDTYENGIFYHNQQQIYTRLEQLIIENQEMAEALEYLGVNLDEYNE